MGTVRGATSEVDRYTDPSGKVTSTYHREPGRIANSSEILYTLSFSTKGYRSLLSELIKSILQPETKFDLYSPNSMAVFSTVIFVVPGTVVAKAFIIIKSSLKSNTGAMGSIQEKNRVRRRMNLVEFKMFLPK